MENDRLLKLIRENWGKNFKAVEKVVLFSRKFCFILEISFFVLFYEFSRKANDKCY